MRVLVLLSGGIDSTSCLHFYRLRGDHVQALFIDFGQISWSREMVAARNVAMHYKIRLKTVKLSGFHSFKSGFVNGRNLFFLATALVGAEFKRGGVAIGVHGGTPYVDCTPTFLKSTNAVFDVYTDGRIKVLAPFEDWSKLDIWNFAISQNVPLELTYSCELGLRQPCGKCQSCRDLKALHARSR